MRNEIAECERELAQAEARRKVLDWRWHTGDATYQEYQAAEHRVYVLANKLDGLKGGER